MSGPGAPPDAAVQPKLRLDKWLFIARFFKSRSLAAEMVEAGHCRLNGQRCVKPGHSVAPGDVLTFAQVRSIRVIRILDLGQRRGPASEAHQLYLDLDSAASDLESPARLE